MFSRYLLYAIGEIILLVIGILLALEIDSKNNDKINRRLERTYLSAISSNLSEDIDELENRMHRDTMHLNAYTQLIQAFATDSIFLDQKKFKNVLYFSSIINYFNPQNTVFEEMKSSGKLNLIKPFNLRYDIMEYYNKSSKVVTSQEINNQYIMDIRGESIDAKLDMNSFIETGLPDQWNIEVNPFDYTFFEKGFADPEVQEFARHISLMKAAVYINLNWKKGLIEDARQVKAQIEAYLAKSKQ